MWRNFVFWNVNDFVKLSESTRWWSDDYDYERHEWEANKNAQEAQKAAKMMLKNYEKVSKSFDRLFSSDIILTLLLVFTLNNMYLTL